MSAQQQRILFENTARAMGDASSAIKECHIHYCTQTDPGYGQGIATALD